MCFEHINLPQTFCPNASIAMPKAGAEPGGIIEEARLLADTRGQEIVVPFRRVMMVIWADTDYDQMLSAFNRAKPGDRIGPCVVRAEQPELQPVPA